MVQPLPNFNDEIPSTGIVKSHQVGQGNAKALTDDDELFIKRLVDENPEKGVELMYRRYFQPLCTHAIKYVGSKAVAEDLVSEVFFEFYKARVFEEITSSYRYYLFRSVRNRAFNYIKWQLNRSEPLDEKYYPANFEVESPYSITQFEEMYQDVHNAVNNLPVDRRRIYLMSRFEGKRYQEIADELKLSLKTVEVQLYRANKFVRALLRDKWLLFIVLSASCQPCTAL